MPQTSFPTDPHAYDAVAGLDTSALFNGGSFSASALQAGTAGVDIANALFGHVPEANGLALIRAVAADQGVSAILSLASFGSAFAARDGSSADAGIAGATIAAVLQSPVNGVTYTLEDLNAAYGNGQLSFANAVQMVIGIAGAGTDAMAVSAARVLGEIASQQQGTGEGGGEGGASPRIVALRSAIATAQTALSGGSLTLPRFVAVMFGLNLSVSDFQNNALNAVLSAIGQDGSKAAAAIMTIAGLSTSLEPYTIFAQAGFIKSIAGSVSLGFSDVLADLNAGVVAGTLSATSAVTTMVGLANAYQSTTGANAMMATEVLALISGGLISATDAATAIGSLAGLLGSTSTNGTLMNLAVATSDLSVRAAFARQIAATVDLVDPDMSMPGSEMTVNQAISLINGRIGTGTFVRTDAVGMLTAIAARGGIALKGVGDSLRTDVGAGNVSAADVVSALRTGATALGLGAAQTVTVLAGVGGSSTLQLQGNNSVFVANDSLEQATAGAILSIATTANLSASNLAAAFAAALPDASGGGNLYWLEISRVLVEMAIVGTGTDAATGRFVGSVIAAYVAGGPVNVGTMTGLIDTMTRVSQTLQGAQAINVLIGMAASGTASNQAAAGQEIAQLATQNIVSLATSVAAVTAAQAGGTLTVAQTTLLLAGTIANSSVAVVGTAAIDALTSLAATGTAGAITAIDAAVAANALALQDAVTVFVDIAGRSAISVQSAITTELLSLVPSAAVETSVNTILAIAAGGTAGMQSAAGREIAAFVDHAGLTGARAIELIDAAITGNSLSLAGGIGLLVAFGAGDSGREALVGTEIASLISRSVTTTTSVVSILQTLAVGAPSDIATVINDELSTLLTDPATLADTAGQGTPAQVMSAAIAILGLLSSDPASAATILSRLAPRIEAGSLTSAQASQLLLDLTSLGGTAETSALSTLQALVTPTQGHTAGDVSLADVTNQVVAMLAASTLSGQRALDVLAPLVSLNAGLIRGTIASLTGTGTTAITIAQIDAAVTSGALTPGSGIVIMGNVAKAHSGALQTAAFGEIVVLATDATTRGLAVDAIAGVGDSPDATIRAGGYAALMSFLAANPTFGTQAFNDILPFAGYNDPGERTDAVNAIAAMVASGAVTTSTLTSAIAAQLASSAAQLGAQQSLDVLVAAMASSAAEPDIFSYIDTVASANHYSQQVPAPGFSTEAAILAIAKAYGGDATRTATTPEMRQLEAIVGATTFVNALVSAPASAQFVILSNLLPTYANDATTSTTLINRMDALLAAMPASDAAATLTSLISAGTLSATQAAQLAIGLYVPGSPAAFLSLAAGMQATALVAGIVNLATAGTLTPYEAQERLAVLGIAGTAALQSAAATAFANALVDQSALSSSLMLDLNGQVTAGRFTTADVVALLSRALLSRLDATTTLTPLIASDISGLISAAAITLDAALTDIAATAKGATTAGMAAIAGEIAGVLSTRSIASSRVVSAIDAAASGPSPTLSATDEEALLIAVAGAVDGDMPLAAGQAIGRLVTAGSLVATTAGNAVYVAFLNSTVTATQAISVGIGEIAGGSPAAAAETLRDLISPGGIAPATVSAALDAAVGSGAISATQAIDVAAGFAASSLGNGPAIGIVTALLADNRLGGGAAVAELGRFIGTTASTISPANFMALVTAVAGNAASAVASIGSGLAELIASGGLTPAQVSGGLVLAVNGQTTPVSISPTLSYGAALSLVIGLAGDNSSAATTANVAVTAGTLFAALIGTDAARRSGATTAIGTALMGGALTAIETIAIYGGRATAGGDAIALGTELAGLVASGALSVFDLYGLSARVTPQTFIALIVATEVTLANGAGLTTQQRTTLTGDLVSFLHTAQGQITAIAAFAAIAQSASAAGASTSLEVQIIADVASAATDPATGIAGGTSLALLVSSGAITASQAVAGASIAMLAGMAEADQLQVAQVSDTFRTTIYAALQALTGFPYTPASVAATLAGYITSGALTQAQGLDVLSQASHRLGQSFALNAGNALKALITAGTVTPAQIDTALANAGIGGSEALVFLASMIDIGRISPSSSLAGTIVDLTRGLANASGVPTLVNALAQALSPNGTALLLSADQAIAALTPIASNLDATSVGSIVDFIRQLVVAPRLTRPAVYAAIGEMEVNGQTGNWYQTVLFIAVVATGLGETGASLVSDIVAAGSLSLGADNAVKMLASLTLVNDASFAAQAVGAGFYPGIGRLAGAGIAALVASGGVDIAHAIADMVGVTGLSDDNRALLLLSFGSATTLAGQRAVGAALAGLLNGGAAPDLTNEIFAHVVDTGPLAVVLASMALNGSSATAATAASLFASVGQVGGAAVTATLVNALSAATVAGTFTAPQEVRALALLAQGVHTSPSNFTYLTPDNSEIVRAALDAELVRLVATQAIGTSAAISTLLDAASNGSAAGLAAVGRLGAALVTAGDLSGDALVAMIDASGLAVASRVELVTGAALSTPALAGTIGNDIGRMVASGALTVDAALTAVAAADAAYGTGSLSAEATMLIAAAAQGAPGLALAAGVRISGLTLRGLGASPVLAAIDAATGATGPLTRSEAADLLAGMAAAASDADRIAIGAELVTLIAAGKLAASEAVNAIGAAVAGGQLALSRGTDVLVALVAGAPATASTAAQGLAGLLANQHASVSSLLAALYASAGIEDRVTASPQTDAAIASILSALVASASVSLTDAASALSAAANARTLSGSHGLAIALDAWTIAPSASTAFGATLSDLLGDGLTVSDLDRQIVAMVTANGMPVSVALLFLVNAAEAAPPPVLSGTERAAGSALAALANAGVLTPAQLVASLRRLVDQSFVDATREAGLLAATAPNLSATIDGTAIAGELSRLVTSGALSSTTVFTTIEAIAGAPFGPAYVSLIASMGTTADSALLQAIAQELSSLVSRNLSAATDVSAAIIAAPIDVALAVRLLAAALDPTVAGSGIHLLVANGRLAMADVVADLNAAVAAAALNRDGEIRLVAGIAVATTDSAQLATLSAALTALVASHAATANDIFADLDTYAANTGSYPVALGQLLAGMSATADASLQAAIGDKIRQLVAAGALPATAAIDAIVSGSGGSALAAPAMTTLLAMAAGADPSLRTAIGQRFGGALNLTTGADAASGLKAALEASLQSNQLTASALVPLLAGLATASFTGTAGANAVNGEVDALVLSGTLSIAQARSFLTLVTNEPVRTFLATFASLNAQALSGSLSVGLAQVQLSDAVRSTYFANYQIGVTLNQLNGLATTLGGIGSTSALAQLNAIATSSSTSVAQTSAVLAALESSGLLAATQEMTSLVASGALTATAAMQAIGAVTGTLGGARTVALLADLSTVPALSQAAISEITALIAAGSLAATATVSTIAGITDTSSATVGALATISAAAATKLLIGLSAQGNNTLVDAAGQVLAAFVTTQQGSFAPSQVLAAIDAAITAHTLSGAAGVRLFGDIVANAGNATAGGLTLDYLTTHLPQYASSGLVSFADVSTLAFGFVTNGAFQAQTALAGAVFAGKLLDLAGGAPAAVTKIHDGGAAGSLTGTQAVAALLGVVAEENALLTNSALSYGTAQDRVNAAYQSASTEILAMVSAGKVTGLTVVADLQALGGLSTAQTLSLLTSLARTGDAATQAAVASALVALGTHWGPSTDSFFSGGLTEAAQDFVAIINGTMTTTAAIADIEAFANTHQVSTDASLILLESLLAKSGDSRSGIVTTEITTRIAIGSTAEELGARVAQGTTPYVSAFGATPQAVDSSAISYNDAKTLLTNVTNQYGGTHLAQDANLAFDVSISQLARTGSFNWDSFAGHVQTQIGQGLTYTGLPSTEINSINASYTSGYAYDQALVTLIDRLGISTAPTASTNQVQAVSLLSRRIMTGAAENDIVNQVANGSLTTAQAMAALDKLIAPIVAGYSADQAALVRQTALGWLAIKSAQYIEGNYQVATQADGTKVKVFAQSEVNTLYGTLLGADRTDTLTGLGALASITNKSIVSSVDMATDFKVVQTIYNGVAQDSLTVQLAQAGIPQGGTLTSNDQVLLTSMAISQAVSTEAAAFTYGWTKLQGVWDSSAGKPGLPGVLHDEVVAKPTDYQSYIDLGSQIVATGVPIIGSQLGIPDITSSIWKNVLGDSGATAVVVVSVASKVLSAVLGINAVSNALGPAAPALKGVFNVTGATADLLGNIVSGVVIAGGKEYSSAATSLGSAFASLGSGDFSGLLSNAGSAAEALFTVSTAGFSPESLGAVASDAGAALLDLASGNPTDLKKSVVALGADVVKALTSNVYLTAAKDAIVRYADTVANDIYSAVNAVENFFNDLVHNPQISSKQDLINDLANVAAQGYKSATSTSNYGTFYHGAAVDGYLSGATVFVDTNGNGVLDDGEYSTTTDASGGYSLPAGLIGPIVITGGTDSSTGLTSTATYSAPNGSAVVSPLTTLVQEVAKAKGDTSAAGVTAANTSVVSGLGLTSSTDLTTLDTEAGVLAGDANATTAFQAGVTLANIFALIKSVGSTSSAQGIYANLAAIIAAGGSVNLTDGTAVNALAANLATSAGLSAAAAAAVGSIIGASTTALQAELSGADPAATFTYIVGTALATQTTGTQALITAATSGTDADFTQAVAGYTTNLNNTLAMANATVSVNLPPASDTAPTISGTIANQTPTGTPITPFNTVAVVDPDVGAVETINLSTLVGGVASDADGTLSGTGLTKLAVGTYQLAAGTPAAVTALLRSLVFTPAWPSASQTITTSFAIKASDGILATTDTTTSLSLTPSSPTISGALAGQETTSEGTIAPFSNVTLTDPNLGATDTLTIVLSGSGGILSGAGLTANPDGTYTLSGSAAGITSQLQALAFTPAAGLPGASSTTKFTITDRSSAFATPVSDQTTTVINTDPTGSGIGDVHMLTFQGLHYDFMAVGDYTLEKSTVAGNSFDVQIRTAAWGNMTSITTEIAAQVGANALDFTLDGVVRVNGAIDTGLERVGSVETIDGGVITHKAPDTYVVNWATGESLTMTNRGNYFDETVSLGTRDGAGSVAGLLGSNTSQATDLALADGTVLNHPSDEDLLGIYATSWSLPSGGSLLEGGGHLPLSLSNLGNEATPFNGKASIDLAHFNAASATLAFDEDRSGTFGTLTVTSGSQQTALILMGQYAVANFHAASDGHGGTMIDYQPPKPVLVG